MALVSPHNGHQGTYDPAVAHPSSATEYVHMAMETASHNASAGASEYSYDGAGATHHGSGQGFSSLSATQHEHSIGHGSPVGAVEDDTGRHSFSPPSTAEHGTGSAEVGAVSHNTSASHYMAFVQGESGDQTVSHSAGGEQPSMTDTSVHVVAGLQEPLSPDHQFADAQIDHGSAQGPGGDTHALMHHVDALTVAAPAPAEPPSAEHLAHVGG
jgi:hypothetical protein